MGWEELLSEGKPAAKVMPWFGFKTVHNSERTWTIQGAQPPEHGWYRFEAKGGRYCLWVGNANHDPDYAKGQRVLSGYLIGNRFIPDDARVDPNPDKLVEQTRQVYCVEPGLERFARAQVVKDRGEHLVFDSQAFPLGPEEEVRRAYQDRATSVSKIQHVTPSLDLAFRWISRQRELQEARVRELERIRAEEERKRAETERIQQAMKDAGTALGRRAVAARDFPTAAREALRVSGAELLDTRDSYNKGEMVVQYRFLNRRLECVVDKNLRVVDAGICLTDHQTGEKGDTWLTLESLPGVVAEAERLGVLTVWRHLDGDLRDRGDDWDDE